MSIPVQFNARNGLTVGQNSISVVDNQGNVNAPTITSKGTITFSSNMIINGASSAVGANKLIGVNSANNGIDYKSFTSAGGSIVVTYPSNGSINLEATGTMGATNLTGSFAVNTNKFTVDYASGNTASAGTISANGTITAASFSGSGASLTSLSPTAISAGTAAISISGNAATVTTNANLTGPVTSSGNATTLSNSAVTGQALTGYTVPSGGILSATNTIMTAFNVLDGAVALVAGSKTFMGTWDASLNVPALTSSVGTKGYMYVVSVAGTTSLNGISSWAVNDQAIYDGTVWKKIIGVPNSVATVAGRVGTVVLAQSDISGLLTTSSPTFAGLTLSTTPLSISSGGTGTNTATGSGANVLATSPTLSSPTLTTPILGTPQSGNFSSGTFTWPTFNQNTTGTAAGLSTTLAVASGGTGVTTIAAHATALSGQSMNIAGSSTSCSGLSATATSLSAGTSYSLPYQSAPGTTAYLANASTSGYILTSVAGGVPYWAAPVAPLPTQTANSGKFLTTNGTAASWASLTYSSLTGAAPTFNQNTTGTATTATNLTGTTLYSLPYQSATGITSYITPQTTTGYYLSSTAGAPTWTQLTYAAIGGTFSTGTGVTGLSIQPYAGGSGYAAIYSTNVTPAGNNYAFATNAGTTLISGTINSVLAVGGAAVALASATGLLVVQLLTANAGITSTAASNIFGATSFSGAITGSPAATLGATTVSSLGATSVGYAATTQIGGTGSLTATTARQVLTSFAVATYRTVEYLLSATQGSSYHTIKVLVMQDGINTYKTSYAEMFTTAKLFAVDATMNGSGVDLGITLSAAVATTIKWDATQIGV